MMCANNQVHYGLKVEFVCYHIAHSLHYHYADLSEGTEHIKDMPVMFCRLVNSFIIIYATYVTVGFSEPIYFVLIVRRDVFHLIIFKLNQILIILHFLAFGHGRMIYHVCLSMLFCSCWNIRDWSITARGYFPITVLARGHFSTGQWSICIHSKTHISVHGRLPKTAISLQTSVSIALWSNEYVCILIPIRW